jgi:hypothetical protein
VGEVTRQLTIKGREYTVQGPTPTYGTYYLTAVKSGAEYVTAQAYTDAPRIYKVVGGRKGHVWSELRIGGDYIRLTDRGGDLRVASVLDIDAALSEYRAVRTLNQALAAGVGTSTN